MSREEFFRCTPLLFAALAEERERERRREGRLVELMIAQLTANMVNFSFRAPKEPVQPEMFILRVKEPKHRVRSRKRSMKALDDALRKTMERAVAYQNAQVERGIG